MSEKCVKKYLLNLLYQMYHPKFQIIILSSYVFQLTALNSLVFNMLWLFQTILVMFLHLTMCLSSVLNVPIGRSSRFLHNTFGIICLLCIESESVSSKSVNQRIGVSGKATAFRIISRFCLNRIWLEKLNQLCPRITGMTLEENLESRDESIDGYTKSCPSSEHLWVPVAIRSPS